MSLDKTDFQRNIKDTVNLSKESAKQIKERLSSINKENVEWARKFSTMFAEGKLSFEDYTLQMDVVRSSMSEVNKEFDALGFASEDAGDKIEKNIGVIALNAMMNLFQMATKVVGKVKQLVLDTVDYADKYGDLSAKYDISTQSLQRFEYIASQSGATLEDVLGTMTIMYNKAKTEGNEAFKKLGVSVKDTNGNMKSMDDLFWETKKALDSVENSGDKSAIMLELFGRNAMSLGEFLRKDAEELEYLGEKAEELGIVMEEGVIDSAGTFNDLLDEMKLRGKSAFAELMMGVEGSEEKFEDYMNDLTAIVEAFIPVFAQIGQEIGKELLKGIIKGVGKSIWDNFVGALRFSVGEGWIWGDKLWDKYDSFGDFAVSSWGNHYKKDGGSVEIGETLERIRGERYEANNQQSQKSEVEVKITASGTTPIDEENAKVIAEELLPYIDKKLGGILW